MRRQFVATMPNGRQVYISSNKDLEAAVIGLDRGKWVVVDPHLSEADAWASLPDWRVVSRYRQLRVIKIRPKDE